jgi:hypothetical protein
VTVGFTVHLHACIVSFNGAPEGSEPARKVLVAPSLVPLRKHFKDGLRGHGLRYVPCNDLRSKVLFRFAVLPFDLLLLRWHGQGLFDSIEWLLISL